MTRGVLVLLLATSASASPNRASLDIAEEIGVLSTTHTTLTGAYARRFWDERVYAEARLGFGTTGSLVVVEERAGIGLVFKRREKFEVSVGWRFGHTHFRGELSDLPFTVNVFALELVVQIAIAFKDDWRIRATPIAPTLFWSGTYAGTIGLELGAEYAF